MTASNQIGSNTLLFLAVGIRALAADLPFVMPIWQ
jgi:hypothetical protein